jgi:hypothetical protein
MWLCNHRPSGRRSRARAVTKLPRHLDRKVHGALTIGWFLLAIPAVLWWKNSVPFLVYVSVYANFVGHWSSYQAAKAEEAVEETVGEAVVEGDPEATALFKQRFASSD